MKILKKFFLKLFQVFDSVRVSQVRFYNHLSLKKIEIKFFPSIWKMGMIFVFGCALFFWTSLKPKPGTIKSHRIVSSDSWSHFNRDSNDIQKFSKTVSRIKKNKFETFKNWKKVEAYSANFTLRNLSIQLSAYSFQKTIAGIITSIWKGLENYTYLNTQKIRCGFTIHSLTPWRVRATTVLDTHIS